MLTFLFGEAASTAQHGASRRLRRWSAAFEDWLVELQADYEASAHRHAVQAWRRLLRQHGVMPWALTSADIEAHIAWMSAEGYSPITIQKGLSFIGRFFRWCAERGIDPASGAGFNPAEQVRLPKGRRYQTAPLLSREEVARLLATMQRDPSELGKRDYAFTLARLCTGAPRNLLQQLTWGQIEPHGEVTWVRWRLDGELRILPQEVWQAIQAYLAASGRLAGMDAGKYVFVPLAEPLSLAARDRPEAWKERRCLSKDNLRFNLKLYGRLAGIPEEKLNLIVLRRTAIRLKMDEGASLEEMHAFLETQNAMRHTKYRLKQMPEVPQEESSPSGESGEQGICPSSATTNDSILKFLDRPDGGIPNRMPAHFKPGDGIKHGFYASRQPSEAVAALVAENIQGIEEEFVGLRILGRRLLDWQAQAMCGEQAVQLGEAYSLAAYRLGEMIKAEAKLAEQGKVSQREEEILKMYDLIASELGWEPVSEEIRAEAMAYNPGQAAAARKVTEEIAAIRYVLRNTFRLAIEAQGVQEQAHLVDVYGRGCMRLVHLLKLEGTNVGRIEAQLNETVEQVLKELLQEWGRE